jgi:phosphatidylinositol alpha-mannosyltransferase
MSDLDPAAGRPLRIGMFCPYSLTVPGGVQAQVLGLGAELRRMGHEVRVLGPCDGPPPTPWVTPLGDSLPTAANGSIAPLAPDPSAALRTIRALRDEDFDVWHLHEPLAPGPTLTALTLHSRPIVATFHAAGRSSSYRALRPVLAGLVRRIDHAVAVSPHARDLAARYFEREYEVLFNGIVLPSGEPPGTAHDEGDDRRRDGVLFIGRHEERKGLAVLLDAMGRLDDEGVRVACRIVGDGPDSERLRRRHGDRPPLWWLGRVSEAAKSDLLTSSLVFAAPSLHGESFGVVLLEAMAAGAVVVASDLDGYRNVATHDVDSLLVPPGDPTALAEAVRRVIADTDLRDRLVRAGHRRAADFSMRRLAEAYIERYRRVIDARIRHRSRA